MPVAPITETTDEQWHRTLDAILGTAFAVSPSRPAGHACRAAPSSRSAPSTGRSAAPGLPAYAAAKAGLEGLVRQLALEYGPHGIRVNAVAPGLIGPTDLPGAELGYPLGRAGTPEEVAEVVHFLAGAGFVTGVVLPVDGGLSIASPAAFLRPDSARSMGPVELCGFGEAMVLFESESLETAPSVAVQVAGAELNVCAAAARLGVASAFCSRVGDDPLGARVRGELTRLGVRDLTVTDPERRTGVFLKEIRPDGQRHVFYYRAGSAASALDVLDVDRLLVTDPGLVVVSGITAALGPSACAAVLALARRVPVAFDPNLRPALGSLAAQVETARELVPLVRYLLLGIDEAELIFGRSDPYTLLLKSPAETVLKAGAHGCFYLNDNGSLAHLPSLAGQVVDPVGAGDAFAGGYLAARLRGANRAGAAWLGSKLAAGVVAVPGDTTGLPAPEEAASLLAQALAPPAT